MQSLLEQQAMNSPLEQSSVIRPKGGPSHKGLVATLILTSLVDAFSILVIYLLVNTSTATENLNLEKEMKLPLATQSEVLQAGVVVVINNDGYKINEESFRASQLMDKLTALQAELKNTDDKRSGQLILQADKGATFENINPVVLAATQSGFSTIKFAVLPKEAK